MKTRRVLVQKYAYELINKGHKLITTEENLTNQNFKVYIFESTDDFELDFAAIRERARQARS